MRPHKFRHQPQGLIEPMSACRHLLKAGTAMAVLAITLQSLPSVQ
jgi:hypothetical protein